MSDPTASTSMLSALGRNGLQRLEQDDGELAELLAAEHRRQLGVLDLIAAASPADPSVLACQAASIGNVTAEGYPGARYHGGCAGVDAVEELAVVRAKRVFGARHANVQPHSCTSANQAVLFGLLAPGDELLGLGLEAGGHLTHGASVSLSGRLFRGRSYGLDASGLLDMDDVRRLALEHRPRLIVAGATAYPRRVDFGAFRRIADEVGAYLLADISHIAGLVAAGEHESPIDHAHVTTTSTYKQLGGPRGGLILLGRDSDTAGPDGKTTLAETIDRAVFPLLQGTPSFGAIAAKARALELTAGQGFRRVMRRVVENAQALARGLMDRGHVVCTQGTDNHLVLVETIRRGLTGVNAERALESCNIVVNKNRIVGDARSARIGGGIRLGTNAVAAQGMGPLEMETCAGLLDDVLQAVTPRSETQWSLDPEVAAQAREGVVSLCARFGVPGYR